MVLSDEIGRRDSNAVTFRAAKARLEPAMQLEHWDPTAKVFFSLDDLNVAIAELLKVVNNKPFHKLEGCRRSLYEELDKPALRWLPERRFEPSTWKQTKVHRLSRRIREPLLQRTASPDRLDGRDPSDGQQH
jgi:hypothetical protein